MPKKTARNIPEESKRVRELLEKNRMSQGELAEKIHCGTQHISNICTGQRKITPVIAEAIARVFGVRSEWIMNNGEYPDCKTDADLRAKLSKEAVFKRYMESHAVFHPEVEDCVRAIMAEEFNITPLVHKPGDKSTEASIARKLLTVVENLEDLGKEVVSEQNDEPSLQELQRDWLSGKPEYALERNRKIIGAWSERDLNHLFGQIDKVIVAMIETFVAGHLFNEEEIKLWRLYHERDS